MRVWDTHNHRIQARTGSSMKQRQLPFPPTQKYIYMKYCIWYVCARESPSNYWSIKWRQLTLYLLLTALSAPRVALFLLLRWYIWLRSAALFGCIFTAHWLRGTLFERCFVRMSECCCRFVKCDICLGLWLKNSALNRDTIFSLRAERSLSVFGLFN
jgi:hypothetical protein